MVSEALVGNSTVIIELNQEEIQVVSGGGEIEDIGWWYIGIGTGLFILSFPVNIGAVIACIFPCGCVENNSDNLAKFGCRWFAVLTLFAGVLGGTIGGATLMLFGMVFFINDK